MKFRYKKFGPFLRPVIPIKIKHKERWIWHEVLVDSGADMCIFDAQIGDFLGVNVEEGITDRVSGIAGQTSIYFKHKIAIEIGGWPYTIEAGFLRNVSGSFNYGVVGQRGFFEHFIVKFDLLKEEIELKERK